MSDLQKLIEEIKAALPETHRSRTRTIREVCLTTYEDGRWSVMAGGHSAVHLGEWGGDFTGEGDTPEEALGACLLAIRAGNGR